MLKDFDFLVKIILPTFTLKSLKIINSAQLKNIFKKFYIKIFEFKFESKVRLMINQDL